MKKIGRFCSFFVGSGKEVKAPGLPFGTYGVGLATVRYKPRVPGKPCTSHKNVGFLNLNARQTHTAQKNKLYCQGRARRKAPVFYCGF